MEEKVIRIMAKIFAVDKNIITDESSPVDIEAWESLKHINLI